MMVLRLQQRAHHCFQLSLQTPAGTSRMSGVAYRAQLLANGYVYYEADCFYAYKNPYIPVDVPEPSMGQINQK
jgi:hypothetical protein